MKNSQLTQFIISVYFADEVIPITGHSHPFHFLHSMIVEGDGHISWIPVYLYKPSSTTTQCYNVTRL